MNLYPELILNALSNVRYPGSGVNLVEAGMIDDDMRIEGNKVSFTLIFERPNDPFVRSVVKSAEKAILTYVSPEVEIEGNIGVRSLKAPRPAPDQFLPEVKHIVAIASGKGGVGKSTVTSNLAIALSMKGYKVGLLDADVFGPSQPKMFHVEDERPIIEHIEGRDLILPIERYGVKMLSIGFFVDKDSPVMWRGTLACNALNQLIADAYWGALDYFLIDLPPGTGDIHISMVQTLALSGAIVVTTPQEVALADVRKGVNLFRSEKVSVPGLGIVENMAWFTPEELPDNRYYIFGKEGGKQLAEELELPLLGQIPIVAAVCEGGDQGEPIALNSDSLVGAAFHLLADKVVERMDYRDQHLAPTKRVEVDK